ncbi:MAG TPA: hypothetical protein VMU94_14235 [Streptosporangiaceae bacterium]|nr:hypothetical protein [Streptosporangiaceae bacterium]
MAGSVRISRSRGSLCGLALVLLGGWGGVAPLAGPSFGYGFTPDQAWDVTHGRLYLSVLPGAVVLVAGLIVLVTRSRAFGGLCALIAALGGAWFIAGAALVRLLPAGQAASITTGAPLNTAPSRIVLTGLTFYAGVGALIVFFAAVALGRFSIAAHKDHARLAAGLGDAAGVAGAGALAYSAYADQQGQPQHLPGQTQDFPAPAQYPAQYPTGPDSFPPDQYSTTPEQYPSHDPFGLTQDAYPTSQAPFPPAPNPFPSGQDPAGATQTGLQRPYGQPDPGSPAP